MSSVLRSAALVAFGFVVLVIQSALGAMLGLDELAPHLMLPILIFLGVSPEVHVVRGAICSFLLGYITDGFCGLGLGLHTFVLVATFLVARGAGLRLFLRGPIFQVVLTFVVGVLAGGAIIALRSIFERPVLFIPAGDMISTLVSLLGPALIAALAAPLLFLAVRRIDQLATRRRDDAAGASSA